MATGTGGTSAATSLTSAQFSGAGAAMTAADFATLAAAILDDKANIWPGNVSAAVITPTFIYPGAFAQNGQLYVPNRGVLKVFPGDRIMVDAASGWPILVSRTALGVAGSVWSSTV